ncbi:TRAP transporter permease [bacterium]|nr:TRAP transporter permease [bacterium]
MEINMNFDRSSYHKIAIATLAISWALFQLSLASWLILDSIKIRALHLAFALSLLFLTIPFKKIKSKPPGETTLFQPTWRHWGLVVVASLAALYIVIDFNGLSTRMGQLFIRDIIVGMLLIGLLLEATRRSLGPALPVIVLLFSIYVFIAPYMPSILAAKGVSINKYINQTALSYEGIFGIPLGVSATVVYLFVLLGALLDKAGAGHYFTSLAVALLGRYKGGPAKASVVSSGLSGMISGSSIANVVTTGTFTIPLMKRVGYPGEKAAAIEVAASTNGQLMPPIMGAAAFIIAEYVNVPYFDVVRAAAIPAFVSYVALFFLTHLEASKLGIKGLPVDALPRFNEHFKKGVHYLIPIGSLIYELIVLRRSTESAAFHAIIILIAIIIYQEIKKSLQQKKSVKAGLLNALLLTGQGMVQGSKNMIGVALATAAAGIIVGVVGLGLGSMITQIVEVLAMGNVFLLLLITAIASLVLGMGLPTTATYIVMASLTAPVIVQVGGSYGVVIPLIAAHLFCFYFGILADDTPPVGLAAYSAAAIAKSDPIKTGLIGFLYDMRTAIIPFFFIMNSELLLINVTGWWYGMVVFVMALLGALAFTSLLQGWLIVKNEWYEWPFLVMTTILLFHPTSIVMFLPQGLPVKIIGYGTGLLILAGIVFGQKMRGRRQGEPVHL